MSYEDGVRSCATLAALERFGRTRHLGALADAFTAAHTGLSDLRGYAGRTIDLEDADSVPGIRELIEVTCREAAASAARGGMLLLAALGSSALSTRRARHLMHAERLVISACALTPAALTGTDRMCWLGCELHKLNVGLWASAVADEFADAVDAGELARALSVAIDTSGGMNSAMLALRAEWWTPVSDGAAEIPELVAMIHAARELIRRHYHLRPDRSGDARTARRLG
ncbi:MAG: hypothetical protein ACLP0J_18785 [Solirubrobacteraceae bacterium]